MKQLVSGRPVIGWRGGQRYFRSLEFVIMLIWPELVGVCWNMFKCVKEFKCVAQTVLKPVLLMWIFPIDSELTNTEQQNATECKSGMISHTETGISFWCFFSYWLHTKLSFWKLLVHPVGKISSKWQHSSSRGGNLGFIYPNDCRTSVSKSYGHTALKTAIFSYNDKHHCELVRCGCTFFWQTYFISRKKVVKVKDMIFDHFTEFDKVVATTFENSVWV